MPRTSSAAAPCNHETKNASSPFDTGVRIEPRHQSDIGTMRLRKGGTSVPENACVQFGMALVLRRTARETTVISRHAEIVGEAAAVGRCIGESCADGESQRHRCEQGLAVQTFHGHLHMQNPLQARCYHHHEPGGATRDNKDIKVCPDRSVPSVPAMTRRNNTNQHGTESTRP